MRFGIVRGSGIDDVAFVKELSVELVARAQEEPGCRGGWLA
jgi:hypothetical protein